MRFLFPLYDLPGEEIFMVFAFGSGLLACLTAVLLVRLVRPPETKEHVDLAMRTQAAVVAAITLTLAFCAVQARTQFGVAERVVRTEAAEFAQAVRLIGHLPADQDLIRESLRDHLSNIVRIEFPDLSEGGRNRITQGSAERLSAALEELAHRSGPTLASELLARRDGIEDARDERLHAAVSGLPVEFWQLITLLFGILFATGSLYPPRRHTLGMVAVQAACLGSLAGFVFQMDQPFRGDFSVSVEPLARVLEHIEGKRSGPVLVSEGGRILLPGP